MTTPPYPDGYPNSSDDFFELHRVESAQGTVVQELIDWDEVLYGDYDGYDGRRCGKSSPANGWRCNWPEGHPGHHDAWYERDGVYLAHWRNKAAQLIIKEEEELPI